MIRDLELSILEILLNAFAHDAGADRRDDRTQ